MDMNKLLSAAHDLLDEATVDDGMGFERNAIKKLVSLRELLNEQPGLEAGGTARKEIDS